MQRSQGRGDGGGAEWLADRVGRERFLVAMYAAMALTLGSWARAVRRRPRTVPAVAAAAPGREG